MRERIEQAVKQAVGDIKFAVERPADMANGDYSTNAALVGKLDAKELASKLKIEGVERVEVAGKFINFYLSHEALSPKEQEVPQLYKGKTILVEYTSPNLFKPLHIGNLIGNILGESVARLLEETGADVKRINYPSDIGLTIAKGVWGLQKNNLDPRDIAQLGKAYVVGNTAYEDGSAKTEIEEINRALYQDTDESNRKWHDLRTQGLDTSLKHILDLTKQLQTKPFNFTTYESQSGPIGQRIVKEHIGDIFEVSEGAVIYRGEQDGLHTRVFLNSQGLPTYEAKELGLFQLKTEQYPNFDISVTVTGSEQKDFFKVVFVVIGKIFADKTAGKALRHIANGFLKLTTGKMSSRLGNVITGESLLADLKEAAKEKMQGRVLRSDLGEPVLRSDLGDHIAEQIAVGAIKYAVLKQGSGRDIIFDPEKSLSLEGDSGPYLQYARVRAVSLLRAAKEAGVFPLEDGLQGDAPEHANVLERTLVHFPEAVERAAKDMEPHHVTTYLTELASAFNGWYASEKVIGGPHQHYGVLLAQVFEKTMAEGLKVLGIPAPEEM